MQNPFKDVVTIPDFIAVYENEEALQISNLHEPLSNQINEVKLRAGIDNASEMVWARYLIANDCGRA